MGGLAAEAACPPLEGAGEVAAAMAAAMSDCESIPAGGTQGAAAVFMADDGKKYCKWATDMERVEIF